MTARHRFNAFAASCCFAAPALTFAEGATTVGVGVDFSQGDYGSEETTRTLAIPLSIKHERGRWTAKASWPYLRAEGEFNREAGSVSEPPRRESGVGDLTLTTAYALIADAYTYGVDLGAKAKLAVGDRSKTLLSSGENDYSLQFDTFRLVGNTALIATLGYTVKGEPPGVDYRNPVYAAFGFSTALAGRIAVGGAYDFREKTSENGAPVREISLFLSRKFNTRDKLQIYAVAGLADGSPAYAGGFGWFRRY